MTAPHYNRTEDEKTVHFNKQFFAEQVRKLCDPALEHFDKIIKSYAFFTILFITGIIAELFTTILLIASLSQSSVLAITLAILFLTVFSYCILRIYFQAKKPEQFLALRNQYIQACKDLIDYQEGIPEHHLALAHATSKLAGALHKKQYGYYKPPHWMASLAPALETFSCWWHWNDVHDMRELLWSASIKEHIKVIKVEPTNLEVHAALANAYVMLSGLYIDPRKVDGYEEEHWIPLQSLSNDMNKKFRDTAQKAIEEFKILNDYAPNDSWIHAQLAYSYHDLQMPEEEIHEYEAILHITPDDKETLLKLGMLYFQQGMNAKGLQAYEELRRKDYKRAEQLIKFYGASSLYYE